MDSTMANEPAATSNALFGPDGTELPDPLPVFLDPLTGPELGTRWDTPDLPPVLLVPDASAIHAVIAAAFGAEPVGPEGAPHPPDAVPHLRPLTQTRQPPHGPAGSALHRPPGSAPPRPFNPVPPADLSRRVDRGRLPARSRGSRTGCVVALIVFGVVAFTIVAQIVESVSALFR